MAALFESLVKTDNRFELPVERHLGLIVFRLTVREKFYSLFIRLILIALLLYKGENHLTEELLKEINKDGKLYCIPASVKGKYIIRFTITSPLTNAEDIHRDWSIIQAAASMLLHPYAALPTRARANTVDDLLSNTLQDTSLVDNGFTARLARDIDANPELTHNLRHSVLESATVTILSQRRKTFHDIATTNEGISIGDSILTDLRNKFSLLMAAKQRRMSGNGNLDSYIEETVENNETNSESQMESSSNELALPTDNDNMDLQIPI